MTLNSKDSKELFCQLAFEHKVNLMVAIFTISSAFNKIKSMVDEEELIGFTIYVQQ